ncbi:hypothetical protein SSX86_030322 [Deinandra increscens subsp. villosa]|uniref:Uncharacterized protein n=1 Tax=Deinandra increscens subsp. villosa TaxID=3103831 RepID=A0AAP0CC33_9ASTR
MSRASSKQQQSSLTPSKTSVPPEYVSDDQIFIEDHELEDIDTDGVTSHIYLKSTNATGTLDKQTVLRRIRHRKRMNMVKSTINSLFSSPKKIRWVDNPFAAP